MKKLYFFIINISKNNYILNIKSFILSKNKIRYIDKLKIYLFKIIIIFTNIKIRNLIFSSI